MIPMSNEEMVHIGELLKADVIARNVFFDGQDESTEMSKAILVKFTLAALGISYDHDPPQSKIKPIYFPTNSRLN